MFINTRYEYTTREGLTDPGSIHPEFHEGMLAEGWCQVWSDITLEGTFVVYRRVRVDQDNPGA